MTQNSRYLRKNIVNRKLPYSNKFDYEVPAVVSAMSKLTIGEFDHLEIKYPMDVDERVSYTQCILRGAALKKYNTVMEEYKQSANELAGDKWDLGALKGRSTDNLWDWANKDGIGYDRDAYLGLDKCVNYEKDI